jgi:N-hydroxyarylamine O-acetyltransferase
MTDDTLDLDAYFDRIRWGGGTAPTLATLAGLVEGHVRAIPFENFDVLLGRGIRLDLDALQAKLVRARRGGYCFEHCTLMQAVLRRCGFEVVAHTARVTMIGGREASPRTHMFLDVALPEGRFVVDPGFGGLAPRHPVPLQDQDRSGDAAAGAWLRRDDPFWVMHVRRGDVVSEGWITTFDVDLPIDFELGNHYTATHPASGFRNRLTMRAYVPGGRITLMNRELTRWVGDVPGTPELLPDRATWRGREGSVRDRPARARDAAGAGGAGVGLSRSRGRSRLSAASTDPAAKPATPARTRRSSRCPR